MKQCNHSNCAVCKQTEDRDVFRQILKTLYPDIYICEHAMYKITNSNGDSYILPSLEKLSKERKGYFVCDIYTSMPIYLTKDNFEVICSKEGRCNVRTPFVAEYKATKKSS